MTYFVIVAVAAGLSAAAPVPSGGIGDTAPAVLGAPKMEFRIYRDTASCEEAITGLAKPAGRRLICLPIERPTGEMASAY